MKLLIADDEKFQHVEVHDAVESVSPGHEFFYADNSKKALKIIAEESIDVAFLDIEMPGETGISLAKKINEVSEHTNIIMVTAYSEYALDALKLYVSGYILKPVQADEIKTALENLRKPVEDGADKLTARCFGNFELFLAGGDPVHFRRQKSKELMAYLICQKGAESTSGEICEALFEDGDPEKQLAYLRRIAADARADLSDAGFDDILLNKKNSYSIDSSRINCDYWAFLEGESSAVNSFQGEFVSQYSWGERFIYDLTEA